MSEILYEVQGTTGLVTLNRPEARNALTFGMYERIAEICRSLTIDGPVKVLVMTGAGGKAFAAGTDIAQFRSFKENQDALNYEATIDRVLNDIETCPIPIIAALTGATTGGGAAIAAACDIRIGDARLRFGFPIARTLGNCLSIGNLNRMASLIGSGRLREILLTSRLMSAEECLTAGFITEILETPEAVQDRAMAMAEAMAELSPLSMFASKEGLRRLRVDGPDADGDDLILGTYMSEDFKEGMESFLGKRKPAWKAR